MSSTSPVSQNGPSYPGTWSLLAPYFVPPCAASAAIVPAFRDLVAKSDLQQGKSIQRMTVVDGLRGGLKAAPTVGLIVGTQMVLQNVVEKALVGEENKANLSSILTSSAVVGVASAPILAVFNGQTAGLSIRESMRRFSPTQGAAIAVQETAFVAGISAADQVSAVMKQEFGDNKAVEYSAAFTSGAMGSLAGHPANTALTRWQNGMKVESLPQLMRGSARKARAIGTFSVLYKLGKEALNAAVEYQK